MVSGVDSAKSTEGEHSRLDVVASDSELLLTRTGSNWIARLPLSRPARYSLRQANTWLALMPCARATRATDAPSANVSSTICRFSSMVRYCRLGLVPVGLLTGMSSVTCVEGSISAPSGHDPYVSTSKDVLRLLLCPDGLRRTLTIVCAKLFSRRPKKQSRPGEAGTGLAQAAPKALRADRRYHIVDGVEGILRAHLVRLNLAIPDRPTV